MERVIFTKYSNDRNSRYNIKTCIVEGDNGKKYVYKSGASSEGEKHVKNMYENFQKLEKIFENSIFEVNKAEFADGKIYLEFIEGENLESILDKLLSLKKYEEFNELIKKYGQEMRKLAIEEFVPSEEYVKIFGKDAVRNVKCKAIKPCDIDMIFSNIVDVNGKWIVLDYEWTFDFNIPVDYVLFRTIYFYDSINRAKLLEGINLYELLGLDESICQAFKNMEDNFQNYVFKGNVPMWDLYEDFGKRRVYPLGLAAYRDMQRLKHKIEVIKYYDDDQHTCELIEAFPDYEGNVQFDIEVDENINTLRIDPSSCNCIIYIDKIVGVSDSEEEILYGNNGDSVDNKIISYIHEDPYIIIDSLKKEIKRVHIEFNIIYSNETMGNHIKKVFDDYSEMRYTILQNDMEMARLRGEIEAANGKIETMENSTSWKVTKPMRDIMTKLRRKS